MYQPQLTDTDKQNIIRLRTMLRDNAPFVYQKYIALKNKKETIAAQPIEVKLKEEPIKSSDSASDFEQWMAAEDVIRERDHSGSLAHEGNGTPNKPMPETA